MTPEIIYEDVYMLVCRKPAGVLAQSDRSFDVDLVSALKTYRRGKGEPPYIGVINRLDRPVDGLMVFAKSQKSAARLNGLMQGRGFGKVYEALVVGAPQEEEGVLEDYLVKDGRKNTSIVCDAARQGARLARLSYKVLEGLSLQMPESGGGSDGVAVTRLRILLDTGRHHQIRVQFASRGLPLVGDVKYAAESGIAVDMDSCMKACGVPRGTMALCACELEVDGKSFRISPQF
jgi:23S rRNA pseudouridine1911/1915/1917 synthase